MKADRVMPKSLHTVSVLVAVAGSYVYSKNMTPMQAVEMACMVLGLDLMLDTYGLKAQAVAKLTAKVKKFA